jgi:hypothetical protein
MKKQPISQFSSINLNPGRLSGMRSRKLASLRLGKFCAAGPGRRLEGEARRAVEDQMRQEGKIS